MAYILSNSIDLTVKKAKELQLPMGAMICYWIISILCLLAFSHCGWQKLPDFEESATVVFFSPGNKHEVYAQRATLSHVWDNSLPPPVAVALRELIFSPCFQFIRRQSKQFPFVLHCFIKALANNTATALGRARGHFINHVVFYISELMNGINAHFSENHYLHFHCTYSICRDNSQRAP